MITEVLIRLRGYEKVNFGIISEWAKRRCRRYQSQKRFGWNYFTGKTFSYAVNFHKNGDFTVYRKL